MGQKAQTGGWRASCLQAPKKAAASIKTVHREIDVLDKVHKGWWRVARKEGKEVAYIVTKLLHGSKRTVRQMGMQVHRKLARVG